METDMFCDLCGEIFDTIQEQTNHKCPKLLKGNKSFLRQAKESRKQKRKSFNDDDESKSSKRKCTNIESEDKEHFLSFNIALEDKRQQSVSFESENNKLHKNINSVKIKEMEKGSTPQEVQLEKSTKRKKLQHLKLQMKIPLSSTTRQEEVKLSSGDQARTMRKEILDKEKLIGEARQKITANQPVVKVPAPQNNKQKPEEKLTLKRINNKTIVQKESTDFIVHSEETRRKDTVPGLHVHNVTKELNIDKYLGQELLATGPYNFSKRLASPPATKSIVINSKGPVSPLGTDIITNDSKCQASPQATNSFTISSKCQASPPATNSITNNSKHAASPSLTNSLHGPDFTNSILTDITERNEDLENLIYFSEAAQKEIHEQSLSEMNMSQDDNQDLSEMNLCSICGAFANSNHFCKTNQIEETINLHSKTNCKTNNTMYVLTDCEDPQRTMKINGVKDTNNTEGTNQIKCYAREYDCIRCGQSIFMKSNVLVKSSQVFSNGKDQFCFFFCELCNALLSLRTKEEAGDRSYVMDDFMPLITRSSDIFNCRICKTELDTMNQEEGIAHLVRHAKKMKSNCMICLCSIYVDYKSHMKKHIFAVKCTNFFSKVIKAPCHPIENAKISIAEFTTDDRSEETLEQSKSTVPVGQDENVSEKTNDVPNKTNRKKSTNVEIKQFFQIDGELISSTDVPSPKKKKKQSGMMEKIENINPEHTDFLIRHHLMMLAKLTGSECTKPFILMPPNTPASALDETIIADKPMNEGTQKNCLALKSSNEEEKQKMVKGKKLMPKISDLAESSCTINTRTKNEETINRSTGAGKDHSTRDKHKKASHNDGYVYKASENALSFSIPNTAVYLPSTVTDSNAKTKHSSLVTFELPTANRPINMTANSLGSNSTSRVSASQITPIDRSSQTTNPTLSISCSSLSNCRDNLMSCLTRHLQTSSNRSLSSMSSMVNGAQCTYSSQKGQMTDNLVPPTTPLVNNYAASMQWHSTPMPKTTNMQKMSVSFSNFMTESCPPVLNTPSTVSMAMPYLSQAGTTTQTNSNETVDLNHPANIPSVSEIAYHSAPDNQMFNGNLPENLLISEMNDASTNLEALETFSKQVMESHSNHSSPVKSSETVCDKINDNNTRIELNESTCLTTSSETQSEMSKTNSTLSRPDLSQTIRSQITVTQFDASQASQVKSGAAVGDNTNNNNVRIGTNESNCLTTTSIECQRETSRTISTLSQSDIASRMNISHIEASQASQVVQPLEESPDLVIDLHVCSTVQGSEQTPTKDSGKNVLSHNARYPITTNTKSVGEFIPDDRKISQSDKQEGKSTETDDDFVAFKIILSSDSDEELQSLSDEGPVFYIKTSSSCGSDSMDSDNDSNESGRNSRQEKSENLIVNALKSVEDFKLVKNQSREVTELINSPIEPQYPQFEQEIEVKSVPHHPVKQNKKQKLEKSKEYKCPMCPLSFKKEEFLHQHKVLHQTNSLRCWECSVEFFEQNMYDDHVAKCHSKKGRKYHLESKLKKERIKYHLDSKLKDRIIDK